MATEAEKIEKLLIKKGFRRLTPSDREKEWYKAVVSSVSCLEEDEKGLQARKKQVTAQAL